jgi:hypothetical protein
MGAARLGALAAFLLFRQRKRSAKLRQLALNKVCLRHLFLFCQLLSNGLRTHQTAGYLPIAGVAVSATFGAAKWLAGGADQIKGFLGTVAK